MGLQHALCGTALVHFELSSLFFRHFAFSFRSGRVAAHDANNLDKIFRLVKFHSYFTKEIVGLWLASSKCGPGFDQTGDGLNEVGKRAELLLMHVQEKISLLSSAL